MRSLHWHYHGLIWGGVVFQATERVAICFYGIRLSYLYLGVFRLRRVDTTHRAWTPVHLERIVSLLKTPEQGP